MTIFPFTFLFNVPGLSNPFTSSAPAVPESRTEISGTSGGRPRPSTNQQFHPQSDTIPLKWTRGPDGATTETLSEDAGRASTPLYKRLVGPPPPHLVRKRAWQSSSFDQPRITILQAPQTKLSGMEQRNARDNRNDEDVDLDLPPSKRHKGIAESVISTAFNAALVGAAVGLTMFRLWRDRSNEAEQSPPPPYQEEWANPTKTHTPSLHKRHGGSIRNRPRVARKMVHIRRDKEYSPRKSLQNHQDVFAIHSTVVHGSSSRDDVLDEMDWIGDRLAKLIEEGKRALGTEIVVASESPEDEVDDGSGNWFEDEASEEASPETSFPSQRVEAANFSRSSHYKGVNSVPNSESPGFPTSLHRCYHSDDPTADVPSTPKCLDKSPSSLLNESYESESLSIRESMERARTAYLQKRGLGFKIQGSEL